MFNLRCTKKTVIIVLACLISILLTSCNYSEIKQTRVLAITEDFQVSINNDGTIKTHGQIAEDYNFNDWDCITSLSHNCYIIVGLKDDGSIVSKDLPLLDNTIDLHLDEWKNIVMVESICLGPVFGLNQNGKVHVATMIDSAWSDVADEVMQWNDIIEIDASSSGIVGVDGEGRVYCSTLVKDKFEETKHWRNVKQACISFDMVVGITKYGEVYATGWRKDYMEPFSDIIGAKKIYLGSTFIVGLMPDETVNIGSLTFYMSEPDDKDERDTIQKFIDEFTKVYTKEELEAIYEYQQDMMHEDLKAINSETDIIDIDVVGDFVVALKKDKTVLVAEIND